MRLTTLMLMTLPILTAASCATSTGGTSTDDPGPSDVYLERLRSVWGEDARRAEVEALGALLAGDAVYEHPRIGARIEGRSAIVDAMAGFLGSTRKPTTDRVVTMRAPGVEVVGFDLRMEQRAGSTWSWIERRQVIVLEMRNGRITKISDHW